MMQNSIYKVAEGELKEIEALKTALNYMFCYNLYVNQKQGKEQGKAELIAQSFTYDPETLARRPHLLAAAKHIVSSFVGEDKNGDKKVKVEHFEGEDELMLPEIEKFDENYPIAQFYSFPQFIKFYDVGELFGKPFVRKESDFYAPSHYSLWKKIKSETGYNFYVSDVARFAKAGVDVSKMPVRPGYVKSQSEPNGPKND